MVLGELEWPPRCCAASVAQAQKQQAQKQQVAEQQAHQQWWERVYELAAPAANRPVSPHSVRTGQAANTQGVVCAQMAQWIPSGEHLACAPKVAAFLRARARAQVQSLSADRLAARKRILLTSIQSQDEQRVADLADETRTPRRHFDSRARRDAPRLYPIHAKTFSQSYFHL